MPVSIILFLQYFVQCLDGLTTGLMYEIALKPEKQKFSQRIFRIFCFFTMITLICLPSYLLHYKILPTVNLIFTLLGTVYLVMRLYKVSLIRALILFAFYILIICVAEITAAVISPEVFEYQMDWTRDIMLGPLFYAWMMTFIAKMAVGIFYRTKGRIQAERTLLPNLYYLNILIFGLLCIPLYRMNLGPEAPTLEVGKYIILFLGLFVIIALITAGIFRLQYLQDCRSLDHARIFADLQNRYYSSVEKNSLAQAKLIHDYKNVILSVRSLLSQGLYKDAKELLEDFHSRLRKTKNPVSDSNISLRDFLIESGFSEDELEFLLDAADKTEDSSTVFPTFRKHHLEKQEI